MAVHCKWNLAHLLHYSWLSCTEWLAIAATGRVRKQNSTQYKISTSSFIFPDIFFHPSRRPPLDATNFLGFYISLIFQFFIISSYFTLYVTVCVLHIGFCSYLNACVEDLSLLTQSIDQQLTTDTELIRIRATFVDIVEIHVKVTRWLPFSVRKFGSDDEVAVNF